MVKTISKQKEIKHPVSSKRLAILFKNRGETDASVISDMVGVSAGTVRSWQEGITRPRGGDLSRLCAYLKCTAQDIFTLPDCDVLASPSFVAELGAAAQEGAPTTTTQDADLKEVRDALYAKFYDLKRQLKGWKEASDEMLVVKAEIAKLTTVHSSLLI